MEIEKIPKWSKSSKEGNLTSLCQIGKNKECKVFALVMYVFLVLFQSSVLFAAPLVVQEYSTIDQLHKNLYELRNNPSVTLDSLKAQNQNLDFNIGDQVSIVDSNDFKSFAMKDISNSASAKNKHTSYWNLWQVYGTLKGYSFVDFVVYNLEKRNHIFDKTTMNPYNQNLDYSSVLYLEGNSDQQNLKSTLIANQKLLSSLNLIDKVSDTTIVNLENMSSTVDLKSQSYISRIKQSASKNLNMKYVIISAELYTNVSLSFPSIANEIFPKVHNSNLANPTEVQGLVLIVPGVSVSISLTADYDFVNQFVADYRKNLIGKSTDSELIQYVYDTHLALESEFCKVSNC